MATLGYKLRIRTADDTADDLVVTTLDQEFLDSAVPEFTDAFETYADDAALEAAWPFSSAPDAPGVVVSLDLTGGFAGTQAVHFMVPTGSRGLGLVIDPVPHIARTISGLTDAVRYTVTVRVKTDWDVTTTLDGRPFIRLVGGVENDPLDVYQEASVQAHGSWETLTVTDIAPVSGELEIRLGTSNGAHAENPDRIFWFDSVVLTGPGQIPAHPYIAEPPEGDGQTLNPITGEVQTGGFTVAVIDALIAANTRVITEKLADGDGRNQLLSRRAFVEETEDAGATWPVLIAGYVNSVRLPNAIRYEFTVGESRRIEQTTKVFEVIEDGFDRASCLIGGPVIGDFGIHPDMGRPRFRVQSVDGDEVVLQWRDGNFYGPLAEFGRPLRDNVRNYINALANHYRDQQGPSATTVAFPDLVCRLMALDVAEGVTSDPPAGLTADTQDFTPLAIEFIGIELFSFLTTLINNDDEIKIRWPTDGPTQPTPGDEYRLVVFPRHITERNPLHWSGHPIDLATGLKTLRGEPYNAASAASVKSELGDIWIEIRPTGPMKLSEALEKFVYGPFGVGVRTNAAGEGEFFTTRRDFTPSVTTLTNDELTSDEGVVWATEEGSAVNKVTLKTQTFSEPSDRRDGDGPIDFMVPSDTIHEAVPDESEVAVFGSQTITYELPGMILGVDLVDFVALLGAELFDFQGRGAITSEISVRRGITAALIGEVVTLDLAHLPTADPSQSPVTQRGTTPRLALVLRRTPTPAGPVLKLQDRGIAPDEQLTGEVTFTIVKSVADPRKIATVEITNGASFVLGEKIRVQMATGSSTPTTGQSAKLLDPTVDDLTFDLPAVDAGEKVWARMRVELPGFTPGDWSAFIGVQLDILQPPTSFAGTFTGRSIPLTWVLGTNAADIPVEILYRETPDTAWTSAAFLPAGTMAYTLVVPDASVEYDLGVRHREAAPFAGTSTITTLLAQTSGVDTETPAPPTEDDPPLEDGGGGGGGGSGGGGHLLVPFHSTLTHGAVMRYPPAATTELEQYGRRRIEASTYARCRVQIQVEEGFELPAGATVGVQYVPSFNTEPAEEDWAFIDGTSGPLVAADAATEIPWVSAMSPLALEARQDIVLRPVATGGDDATAFATLQMFVEFFAAVPNDTDETVPDPCQDSTIDFDGYDDTAAATTDGWTNVPDASNGGEMALDETGGIDGSKAIRMDIAPSTFNYTTAQSISYEFSGLEPSTSYELQMGLKLSSSFLEDPLAESRFSVSVSFGGVNVILWFGGVTPDGPSDARPYIGAFKILDQQNSGDPFVASSDVSGNMTLSVGFSSLLAGASIPHSIWLDNIRITAFATGELALPCTSGETVDPDENGDPPVLPASGDRKIYLWSYHQSLWGDYDPFNATHIRVSPEQLVSTLTAARAINMGFWLVPVSSPLAKVNGVFNQAKYMSELEKFLGVIVASEWTDVLRGIEVMDEPNSIVQWGTSVDLRVVDRILAKRCGEIFPGIPLQVRMRATFWEKAGVQPSYVQIAVNHWVDRLGTTESFMSAERASARRLQMAWAWGTNPVNGGSGESGIPGERGSLWRMSPTEYRDAMLLFANDTESHSISVWAGNNPPNTFLQEPAWVAATQAVIDRLAELA